MRKTILKLLTAVLLVLNGTMLFSQEKKVVKGVVSDSAGPIPGVGVVVDGTTNGVVTDIDGRYELKCNSGQTLEFSCMGYETVKVAVGKSDVYNVVLTPQSEQLDQVVFVGYGVQKKVNVTGSVTSVDYSKLADSRPVTNSASLLQGASAGLYVRQTSGIPGNEGVSLRVRGTGTLNNSDPLVIVDGTPGSMDSVDPSEIQNISVLKDAASCAIYGNRGANGVILITTKREKKDSFHIDYSGMFGVQSPENTYDVVSNYADYYDYVAKRGVNIVKDLIAKYKEIAPYSEEPDTFFDFGDDEKFSLIKYGKAECSAGLFDIIEIDQDTIREKLGEIDKILGDDKSRTDLTNLTDIVNEEDAKKIEKLLHDIVFSENRMLLVTRGLDPRTDDDVYNGFEKEFIAAGIIPQKFKVLTDKARNNESLIAEKPLIDELADLLNDLYQNMDDSLQFKLPATQSPTDINEKSAESARQKSGSENEKEFRREEKSAESAKSARQKNTSENEQKSSAGEPEAISPDVKKDFRGVMCPMNFVKTKIALTPMQSGQILEILLDDGAPIENVPGSVKNEGHTILSTEKVENYWKVLIKKK